MRPKTKVGSVWPTRVIRSRTAAGGWALRRRPIVAETFAVPDQTGWPSARWASGLVPAGGGPSVASGVGQLVKGATGGYSSNDFVSVRSLTQLADFEISFTFTIPDTDVTGVDLMFRATSTELVAENAVRVSLRRDNLSVATFNNWVSTSGPSISQWLTAGVAYRARVVVVASVVKARIWLASDSEPSTWQVEATGIGRRAAGHWGFLVPAGSDSSHMTVTVDDIEVHAPSIRDRTYTPFASSSIWNTPIGTDATYSPLNLTAPPMYGDSATYIVLDPNAPLRSLVDRGYHYQWNPDGTWKDGTSVVGTDTGVQVRFPDGYLIPPPPEGAMPDRPSAAVASNGNYREFQYTVRPTATSNLSIFEAARAEYAPDGDGRTMLSGSSGGHGGSGLSAIGGALRVGELESPDPIRHVLSFTLNLTRWGTKNGGGIVNGYRWPAFWADTLYSSTTAGVGYGTLGETPRSGLGSGSLLAIPATTDLAALGFETTYGAKLAWTCQNYGGYVTDNTGEVAGSWHIWQINSEVGVGDTISIGTVANPASGTALGRDLGKIYTNLAVVMNNSSTAVGGGGIPLQPWLPAAA